jgi:hypothetical protein
MTIRSSSLRWPFIGVVALGSALVACDREPAGAPETSAVTAPEPTPPARAPLSPTDEIYVELIAVQYATHWKYVGAIAFNVGTGRPRLPDPLTEDFIVVVREPQAQAADAPVAADLEPGFAYQWLGDGTFHRLRAVDLALSDEEISKLFGVGKPSVERRLVDLLNAREIDAAETQRLLAEVRRLNYRDEAGRGLLHQAAYFGHMDVVLTLINRGADVNLRGMSEDTPVSSAAAGGNPAIIETLITFGADIAPVNVYGNSALHAAMYNDGCVECARILIANGANPALKNRDGMTPQELAVDNQGIMKNYAAMIEFWSSDAAQRP